MLNSGLCPLNLDLLDAWTAKWHDRLFHCLSVYLSLSLSPSVPMGFNGCVCIWGRQPHDKKTGPKMSNVSYDCSVFWTQICKPVRHTNCIFIKGNSCQVFCAKGRVQKKLQQEALREKNPPPQIVSFHWKITNWRYWTLSWKLGLGSRRGFFRFGMSPLPKWNPGCPRQLFISLSISCHVKARRKDTQTEGPSVCFPCRPKLWVRSGCPNFPGSSVKSALPRSPQLANKIIENPFQMANYRHFALNRMCVDLLSFWSNDQQNTQWNKCCIPVPTQEPLGFWSLVQLHLGLLAGRNCLENEEDSATKSSKNAKTLISTAASFR